MKSHSLFTAKASTLGLFLFIVLLGGTSSGLLFSPDSWYVNLTKPSFNPPAWVFGPAWMILYILIAISGWLTFWRQPTSTAYKLWWVQMVLNFAWTPIFFGAHAIGTALGIILAMFATIVAYVVLQWPQNRHAALLFIPYAFWVAFATLLNASLLLLNPA